MKKILIIYILFISLIFSQKIIINDVDIIGLTRLKHEDIYRISKLYPGRELIKGDEINKGIERLWKIGRFSNVQIYVIDEKEESLAIKIILEEFPIVNSIKFIGNSKFSSEKLNELINISYGQIITENLIFVAKNNIINKYKEDGFHNVIVNNKISDLENIIGKELLFNISEGNKIKVKKINIIGNTIFSNKKILKNFNNTKPFIWPLFWRGKFNNKDFNDDLLSLELFYKNRGYKDFQIIDKKVNFNKSQINIDITINEGAQFYYSSFSFEGNEKFSEDQLIKELDIAVGDIYNQDQLNFAIYEKITSLYMNEGYYFFNINQELKPNGNILDAKFIINENEKVTIRKILIAGNTKTNENVIRREIKIMPGDIFNRKKIIESIQHLYLLNFFQSVNPEIVSISDNLIDIKFTVAEKETGRANFSMGYNELNGLTGGGGFEFANFMGKGQSLSIEYQRGLQNQLQSNSIVPSSSTSSAADFESFSIRFREPRIFDTRNSIGISFSHQEQGTGDNNIYKYNLESDRFSLSFGRRFKWPDSYFRGDWYFSTSNTKYFGDESDLLSDFDPDFQDAENSNIVYYDGSEYYALKKGIAFNQVISRDSRDHAEFPTTGSQFMWSTTISGGLLGGNVNYNKHLFSFSWFTPMISKLVLFQNYKFGVINELSGNKFIPYNARFLMGGSGIPSVEMLRGYDNNSIGPGGNYYSSEEGKIMLKYSMEVRYLLSESPIIYMLTFAEAGNVWTDFNEVDIFDLKRSAGIGIRLYMPMLGILGYDIGYGFDNIYNNGEPSGWEHHVIFGMPFN